MKWVTKNLCHRNKITRTCYVNKDTYHNVSVVAKVEKKKSKKERARKGGGKKKEKEKLIKEGRKAGKKRGEREKTLPKLFNKSPFETSHVAQW